MKEIQLTRGFVAIVDDEDYELLAQFKWYAEVRRNGQRYACRTIRRDGGARGTIRMHQQILSIAECEIDHINGNGLDNRRANLRPATRRQQTRNTRGYGLSGLKGVTRLKRLHQRPWQARIAVDGQQIHLGYFATSAEAAAAYDRAAREHYGEFARTNS